MKYLIIIIVYLTLSINKNYSLDNEISLENVFVDENLPPESIININNPIGALVPSLEFSVYTLPYHPLLLLGRNLGTPEKSNVTIYVGKLPCTQVIYFTNQTLKNELDNRALFIEQDKHYFEDYYYNVSYISNLLEYTYKHPDTQILKCDLQTINISSIYLKAQDIYIVVDGVLGIADNYFIYNDVSSCASGTLGDDASTCNDNVCFLGICLCDKSTGLEGPLCNLKRIEDYGENSNLWLNATMPEIKYSNGNSSWAIKFFSFEIAKKSVQDSRFIDYNRLLDFEFISTLGAWEFIDTTFKDNTNDKTYKYRLITEDITIEIDVMSIGRARKIAYFPEHIIEELKFGIGDLRISITLSDLSEELKDNFCFKMKFNIISSPNEKNGNITNTCGKYHDLDINDNFNYGKGYDRDDIRWISITNNFSTLYSRLYGKCISDQLPQSCIYDLNEDPEWQIKGNADLFLFFEPFKFNVTTQADFKILTYNEFPNFTFVTCKESIPKNSLTIWLIPSIIPIISLGLFCLALVVYNLVLVNRKSLEFDRYSFNVQEQLKNNKNNDLSDSDNGSGSDNEDTFSDDGSEDENEIKKNNFDNIFN